MESFGKNFFYDVREFIHLLKVANENGNALPREQLSTFAELVRRSKQTLDDWELFSSLQTSNNHLPELQKAYKHLVQHSLTAIKDNTNLKESFITINKHYHAVCSLLVQVMGSDANLIPDLVQLAQPVAEKKTPDLSVISQAEYSGTVKQLAMPLLVFLKELSANVINSIPKKDSTASQFAHDARGMLQASQSLNQFLSQHGNHQVAEESRQSIVQFIAVAKDIFMGPIKQAEEQVQQKQILEKLRANIAIQIKNILTGSPSANSSNPNILSPLSPRGSLPVSRESSGGVNPTSVNNVTTITTNANSNTTSASNNSSTTSITGDAAGSISRESSKDNVHEEACKQSKQIEAVNESQTLSSSGEHILKEAKEGQDRKANDRRHAFNEILYSEKIYFTNLQFVFWGIITPLKEAVRKEKSFMTEQELQLIFSNWESLMSFNKELMKKIEQRKDIPIDDRLIGDTFLDLAPLMKMYTEYINNFDVSMVTLKSVSANEEFTAFVQKCLAEAPSQGLDLNSYLIMPVQRLPRYEMLLRALWKLTEENHPDYGNLAKVTATVKAINDHVNLKKKEAENRAVVMGIQDRILGFNSLVQPFRLFIREGPLSFCNSVDPKKTKKKSASYVFLFNDIILLCKFNKKKNLYDFKESFELAEYYLRDVKYNPFMSSSERYCFKIVKQNDERLGVSFFASSEEEKKEWIVDVEDAIKTRDAADNSRYI